MKLKKIRPIVAEYASNLCVLFVTEVDSESRKYVNFFNFLFKNINFYIEETDEAQDIWDRYSKSIDLVIISVQNKECLPYRTLIKEIRNDSDTTPILILINDDEIRESFTKVSCYDTDGFLPSPFHKDVLYKYLYRFLKRIVAQKELQTYISKLGAAEIAEHFPESYRMMHEKSEELQESADTMKIGQEKMQDIRFHQSDKMTSQEFVDGLDGTILTKVKSFQESLGEYALMVEELEQLQSEASLQKLLDINAVLSTFYYIMDIMSTFPIVFRTFSGLVNFLGGLSAEELEDKEKKAMLGAILLGIGQDLESWITNIFIEQNTNDIHYFDASFANNILELEALFNNIQLESDEDDLDFF